MTNPVERVDPEAQTRHERGDVQPGDGDEVSTEVIQPEPTTRAATITVEGQSLPADFQILAEAGGYNQPTTLSIPVTVNDGVLDLSFSAPAGFDEAQINAINVAPALLLEQEKLNPAKFRQAQIYNQPDRNLPGYNPNEEHALLAPS